MSSTSRSPAVPTTSRPTRATPRVLIIVGTYLPGTKGGGHIRSIAALAHHLGDQLDLFVVCRNRDAGDSAPYPDLPTRRWTAQGSAHVMYIAPSGFTFRFYRHILKELDPDVLYLNTPFSIGEAVLPALAASLRSHPIPLVMAPRGGLDPGALSLKRMKKLTFLRILRLSRLPHRMTWQASTELEASHIVDRIGNVRVLIASDFPMPTPTDDAGAIGKVPGQLRILFLSRISPKKNLPYLLDRVAAVRGHVELTIAGPIEDPSYWDECKRRIASLPENVRVTYAGSLGHKEIPAALAAHHLFALPTLGENFGHAIIEALSAGCPAIISDQTPWHQIEEIGAGWTIPLEHAHAWESALQTCCDMGDAQLKVMRKGAASAIGQLLDLDGIKEANLALLAAAPEQAKIAPRRSALPNGRNSRR